MFVKCDSVNSKLQSAKQKRISILIVTDWYLVYVT